MTASSPDSDPAEPPKAVTLVSPGVGTAVCPSRLGFSWLRVLRKPPDLLYLGSIFARVFIEETHLYVQYTLGFDISITFTLDTIRTCLCLCSNAV